MLRKTLQITAVCLILVILFIADPRISFCSELHDRCMKEIIDGIFTAQTKTSPKGAEIGQLALEAESTTSDGQCSNVAERLLGIAERDQEIRAMAYLLKSMCTLFKGKNAGKAVEYLTSAVKISHMNTRIRSATFTCRGLALLEKHDYTAAIGDFNKALELDPADSLAMASRAMAYLRQNRPDIAQNDAKKAVEMKHGTGTEYLAVAVDEEISRGAIGSQVLELPLDSRGHAFVEVRFGPHAKPHRFLLDTGATYSLVGVDIIDEIDKKGSLIFLGTTQVRTADGSTHRVLRFKVKEAYLQNLPLGDMEIHTYESPRTGLTNLLGIRSLKGLTVSLDPESRKLVLRRRGY